MYFLRLPGKLLGFAVSRSFLPDDERDAVNVGGVAGDRLLRQKADGVGDFSEQRRKGLVRAC